MLRQAFVLTCGLAAAGPALACEMGVIDLRTENTAARFMIQIADTPESQAQGLMFVEHMPRFEGMLFVNDEPRRATFWMKTVSYTHLTLPTTSRV